MAEKKSALHLFFLIICVIGLLFAVWLVAGDLREPGFCPKLFGSIPACYLVFAAFALTTASVFIKKKGPNRAVFLLGFLLGFGLANWFSVNHIFDWDECPVLFDIPLCYVSFLTFLLLLIIKAILHRKGQWTILSV